MNYAIIKVINGNYFVHAEGITDLTSAKTQYHGLCQALWNASDVYTGTVAIVDENLEVLVEYMQRYQETITHDRPQPEPEPTPEEEPTLEPTTEPTNEGE